MVTKSLDEHWVFGSRLHARRLPLCPEIALWLLGDEVDLHARVSEVLAMDTAPYWAFCWGSGQALARFVLDHPQLVAGKHVVDFGAGSGVAAIAAAKAGAQQVTAVDLDPHALEACRANAQLNQVAIATVPELPLAYDVLLASDVLYEVGNRAFLEEQVARRERVLVSDPLRPGNPRLSREPRARYDVTTVPDVDYPVSCAVVYVFEGELG